ncbi:MAG: S41 family peptidase [candidate division Zixibacteria bacterium]|nr:S41 family peptidase [candidate division Zixibacteria bacterium]
MSVHKSRSLNDRQTILILAYIVFLLIFLNPKDADSQETNLELDESRITEVIDTVLAAFEAHYVYPDIAGEFCDSIRHKHEIGEYGEIDDLMRLTDRLSEDLRKISGDLHIRVIVMSPDDFNPAIGDTITHDKIAKKARTNFNFKKVEWLPGNVGYLRFDQFADPVYAGQTAVAAMNFLAYCDAIIIDLRNNGGGEEKMVRLISSYFFKEPIQINSLYFTETDSLEQSWTYAYVPGKKLTDVELYILTSGHTASGAEAFAYSLKSRNRATVVGESTAGAAHWVEYYDFPKLQVRAKIPIARPINPITKTSWEKIGVKPDIETSAANALDIAHVKALKNLISKSVDETIKRDLSWFLIAAEASANPVEFSEKDLQEYTGVYAEGRYGILIKEGRLFWRYTDGNDYVLIPITKDLFGFDDTNDVRIQIVRDKSGDVSGFRLVYRDDHKGSVRTRTGDWIESF